LHLRKEGTYEKRGMHGALINDIAALIRSSD
jgi:hypothetical protein